MSAKILVIGGGGREHAITWKLSQSQQVGDIFLAPGNCAIRNIPKVRCANVDLNVNDFVQVSNWCKQNAINLVVVGPEDPLANGIADALTSRGIAVFGPNQHAAQLEANKGWAKAFMDRNGIPTAKWKAFTDANEAKLFINNADFGALVVKASGLATGKGVVVAANKQEACEAVDSILTDKKFGSAGEKVVIEELLEGEEISVLAFCDGKTVQSMLPSQDHKRIFDGDLGPNTGGMGAYCPCQLITEQDQKYVQTHILEKTVNGLLKENIKYVGVLYAGLMLTKDGPKVLEFNCRFGDPETEVILPLLESDLFLVMQSCCNGSLGDFKLEWKSATFAAGVIMASRGYPESSSKGQIILGTEDAVKGNNNVLFHCGTTLSNGQLVTNGGRVLIMVALAPELAVAAAKATLACGKIQFDGRQYRKDIGHKGICRSILDSGRLSYKASGVDIQAGDFLVDSIKPLAKSTCRSGLIGGIGGFGGLFDVKAAGFNDPLLVSGTDGVGTKLKIAQEFGLHDGIGIDLVAMCVNDVLAHGATPLFFLDYFSCGKLDVGLARKVVGSIAKGCLEAGCVLIGGETAEMPDMYKPGEYDLAGFAVGAVERTNLLPRTDEISKGDVVIGLPSSGLHSNGFSLVRKIVKMSGIGYSDPAPFSQSGRTLGEELLVPTQIYVKQLKEVISKDKIKAFAHITGGGLVDNIPRILPPTLGVNLNAESWMIPPVFGWLATIGGVNETEMLRTFNCGIGAAIIVSQSNQDEVLESLQKYGAKKIGEVVIKQTGVKPVTVTNFNKALESVMRPFLPLLMSTLQIVKKKVGVLISGSGTNLQALIDATKDATLNIPAEIVLVISNKAGVEGINRAQRANIPCKVMNHKDYPSRLDFDNAMDQELTSAGVEIICLAGFMRILSGDFTRKWSGRLLNIHPSLLPSFKGANACQQALKAGVRITGCSVHFVVEDIDAGAVIVQEAVPVHHDDTEETLLNRIHTVEHIAYPKALELISSGKVKLGSENKLIWSN